MQYPTRTLTRPEHDLLRAIQEAAFQKWNPIVRDAENVADQAENEANRIEAEVKATPEYQDFHRVLHGPSTELSAHIEALGGYSLFRKKWGEIEAPIEKAKAAVRAPQDRHEQLVNDADDASNTALVLTFLRLGYRAGAQDALDVANNPGSPADVLKFMRDLMDDSPTTDALLAPAVDKLLNTPAMASLLGGDR